MAQSGSSINTHSMNWIVGTEIQRGTATCLRSHSKSSTSQDLWPGPLTAILVLLLPVYNGPAFCRSQGPVIPMVWNILGRKRTISDETGLSLALGPSGCVSWERVVGCAGPFSQKDPVFESILCRYFLEILNFIFGFIFLSEAPLTMEYASGLRALAHRRSHLLLPLCFLG